MAENVFSVVFNTFQKVEKYLYMRFVCLSVCPSMHSLTVVNILQISLNLYMLFISDIERTILKLCAWDEEFAYRDTKKFSDKFQPIRGRF